MLLFCLWLHAAVLQYAEEHAEHAGGGEDRDDAIFVVHGNEGEGDDDDAAPFGRIEAYRKALRVPDGEQDEVDRRAADERDDGGAQAVQYAADRADVAILEEEFGECDAEDQRREGEARCCRDGAPGARDRHACEGCGVDADGTGRHLRDREDVDELGKRQPAALIDDSGLDERHGSVAAADTEDADLGKLEEELKIYHDRAPLSRISCPA